MFSLWPRCEVEAKSQLTLAGLVSSLHPSMAAAQHARQLLSSAGVFDGTHIRVSILHLFSSVSVPLQVNYMPDFVIRNQLQIQLIDPICLHYQIFHLLGFFAQFGGPTWVGNIIKPIAVRKVFCYSHLSDSYISIAAESLNQNLKLLVLKTSCTCRFPCDHSFS